MRIAQIAPLWELVPPRAYGGTELVAHLLTEGLVKRGHDVTLFAVRGSQTSGCLKEYATGPLREMEEALVKDKTHCTVMASELSLLGDIFTEADRFDVIHNHMGFQALPFANFVGTPMVTTLHNALSPEPVRALFLKNAHQSYISISEYQRKLWPELNYAATIYHGIDLARFKPAVSQSGEPYLAFLGRLSPEKGPQYAIEVAETLGMRLLLAGKIDRVDRAFFLETLAPRIDGRQVVYIGELEHEAKVNFLRNAAACLFPVQWPEPFGLVMIEAMACGTPVFALRDGSVPEVIDHGVSGYVADSVSELTAAVRNYKDFDRAIIRKTAEARFSAQRMVLEHERLYQRLVVSHRRGGQAQHRFNRGAAAKSPLPLHLAPERPMGQFLHPGRSAHVPFDL